MPTRRDGRASHVRPRPPSTGRPAPQRVRVPAPDAYRLKQARGLDRRRRGLPLPARLLLVVAVVVLGGAVFATASGGIGSLVKALGGSLSGFVKDISATSAPSATPTIIADAPVIASPPEPYTNQSNVDLEVTIPSEYVGDPAVRVRVYLALEGQEPAPILETAAGSTRRLVVPVQLTTGRNDLSATIVDSGVESEASPIVTYILDAEPPAFVLTAPLEGETVNRPDVTITGTTQPRTTLMARNQANGTSISGEAAADGTFSLVLPLDPGPNAIKLKGTDPAGNQGELTFSVVGGGGALKAVLTSSANRISVVTLPVSLQLNVLVTDPDGLPLGGARVTFNLTVPGIPPVAKEAVTGIDGRATFTTTLPAGVTVGSGIATVVVATDAFGETSANKTIAFVE